MEVHKVKVEVQARWDGSRRMGSIRVGGHPSAHVWLCGHVDMGRKGEREDLYDGKGRWLLGRQ